MTQKEALIRALEIAERSFRDDSNTLTAARAGFVALWLEDMNWHPESGAIAERALATQRLKVPFEKLQHDIIRIGELQDIVSFFNSLFGWGLKTTEWRATQGAGLVEELWEIILSPINATAKQHE
jgi:hypothetical protein